MGVTLPVNASNMQRWTWAPEDTVSPGLGPCQPLRHSRIWGTASGSWGISGLCQDGSNHSTGRRQGGPGARRPQPTHHLHGWREHHPIEANEVSVVERVHGVDFPDEVVHGLGLAQHVGLQALHGHAHLPSVEMARSQDRPQAPACRASLLLPPTNILASDLLLWVGARVTGALAWPGKGRWLTPGAVLRASLS